MQTQANTKEDPKKKKEPAGKNQPAVQQEQPIAPEDAVQMLFNDCEGSIAFTTSEEGIDVSDALPSPKFPTEVFILTEPINIIIGSKAFNQAKTYDVIVGILVGWVNTNCVEIHKFNLNHRANLPEYLQISLNQQIDNYSSQHSDSKHLSHQHSHSKTETTKLFEKPPAFTTTQKKATLLYPISSLQVNQSKVFLAVGLQQGSILIYDIPMTREKFYLDKHNEAVSALAFCEDWRLVSGAQDGSVHIYDLNTKEGHNSIRPEMGKLVMKRTNQFRKPKYPIVSLVVSASGVAVALDSNNEAKLYDVWHGEKIAKLNAQQVMDDRIRLWSVWPKPVVEAYKSILNNGNSEIVMIADSFPLKIDQEEMMIQSEQWQKQTCIQVYKIFDNLIHLFPSLSNVYRRGIEKDKIIHLFAKIDKQQLCDPNFEVPTLEGGEVKISGHLDPHSKKRHSMQGGKDLGSSRQNRSQHKDVLKKIKEENQSQTLQLVTQKQISLKYKHQQNSKGNSLNSGSQSDPADFNSSFKSQRPSLSDFQKPHHHQQGGLTKQKLHPEKFLLEKEKVPIPIPYVESDKMNENIRNRVKDKNARQDKVNNFNTKLGNTLQVSEEKRILQEKQKLLSKVTSKK